MIPMTVVKSHLNLYHDRDDELLNVYQEAAIQAAEHYTNIAIKSRGFTEYLSGFSEKIDLGIPLESVKTVIYRDENGVTRILEPAVYEVVSGLHGYMRLGFNQRWPALQAGRHRSIAIEYTAGFSADTLPDSIKVAILIMLGNLYENREPVSPTQLYEVPLSFQHLLNPFKRVNI